MVDLSRVRSNGYAFQIEMTYRLWRRGGQIRELPIIFADRTVGESKMSKRISLEAFWIVWWLKMRDLRGKL
jgi:dolichol-phosphate mannosyltransferase